MKIQIENLKAQMRGVQLNNYRRALALDEYYKLLDYVTELEQLTIPDVSGSLLSFEQCLREEFLVNTQNYPKEYHNLFNQKFERAEKRFKEQSGNDR